MERTILSRTIFVVMNHVRLFLLMLVVLSANGVKADKIEKAFQSLKVYNYFDAKKKFEQKLKKAPSPAAYGLAIIYFRQDNPFHQIDSAYRLIRVAKSTFSDLKVKKSIKYAEYGYTMAAIDNLQDQISNYYFEGLSGKNSVSEWSQFIDRNPLYFNIKRARFIRDSLAFGEAKSNNSSRALNAFLENYPETELNSEAQKAFYLSEYREQTQEGTIESYELFLHNFPDNPNSSLAQDQIYSLATGPNTVSVLDDFIKKYPNNRNKEEAWRRLYQVYMYEYSDDRIEQFESEFSDYPFKNELKSDLQLSRLNLFPYKVFTKYGAMDTDGNIVISPTYESMNLFSEGLALVSRDGRFGYINKENELIIPCIYYSGYDFESGRAIVELKDKFGLIDRTGKIVLPIEFDDIGSFSEGLIYAQKGDKYGYYDRFGQEQIQAKYTEAFSFVDGLAKVQIGNKQTYINLSGEEVVSANYDEVNFLTTELLIFLKDDLYGLENLKGKEILAPIYDNISFLSNGMAMIIEEGEVGYIDSTGNIVIKPQFEQFANCIEIGQFRDGLAIVKSRGKMGLIDQSGTWYVKNIYTQLGKNSKLIAFNNGKLWGYIDPKGKVVVAPKYDWAESFDANLAIVAKGEKQGVLGKDNEELLPIEYNEITRIGENYFLLQKENKLGLMDAKGVIVVPLRYDEIRQLNEATFVLVKDKQLEYLYLPDNKIVQLK